MTEEQIERVAERLMDTLDARYIQSGMTEEQYSKEVQNIKAWADREYRLQRRMKSNDE